MYRIHVIFITVLCPIIWTKGMTDLEALVSQPKKCTYSYAFDMYGANCVGLGLENIPKLQSRIEILDFGDNKLRRLNADTLIRYTNIKLLYLPENKIHNIEDNAFTELTSLEVLDLSKNVITVLPVNIFELPSLRNLYLSGNPFSSMSSNFSIDRPIKAPLQKLDLSDCDIRELPDLGMLPQLIVYNISYNPLRRLPASLFAKMCYLREVDLTESIDKIRICDLKPTVEWFVNKNVSFLLQDYSRLNSNEFQNCLHENISPELAMKYNRCKAEYKMVQFRKASRRTWLSIGAGLGGFLIGFILLLYLMHRRNVAQTKKLQKGKNSHPLGSDNTNDVLLLNDVS